MKAQLVSTLILTAALSSQAFAEPKAPVKVVPKLRNLQTAYQRDRLIELYNPANPKTQFPLPEKIYQQVLEQTPYVKSQYPLELATPAYLVQTNRHDPVALDKALQQYSADLQKEYQAVLDKLEKPFTAHPFSTEEQKTLAEIARHKGRLPTLPGGDAASAIKPLLRIPAEQRAEYIASLKSLNQEMLDVIAKTSDAPMMTKMTETTAVWNKVRTVLQKIEDAAKNAAARSTEAGFMHTRAAVYSAAVLGALGAGAYIYDQYAGQSQADRKSVYAGRSKDVSDSSQSSTPLPTSATSSAGLR